MITTITEQNTREENKELLKCEYIINHIEANRLYRERVRGHHDRMEKGLNRLETLLKEIVEAPETNNGIEVIR